ncbi:phage head spike fiber domain-containing protein [Brevundimonas balnearis]|uniref:Uncharacterized protein n=1 Tax=Brevundimonas balnearis TaxID=1572858 RepID=A0ABV6R6Q4_9CAUL
MLGLSNGLWGHLGPRRIWDFTRPGVTGLTFSRASTAIARDAGGGLSLFANGQPRLTTAGLLLEPAALNKLVIRNAEPLDLTGVSKGGDAAATLSLVNDAAAVTGSGLGGVCGSGVVFRLDNSAGSTAAYINFPTSVAGATSAHSISIYSRGGTGVVGTSVSTTGLSSGAGLIPASILYRRATTASGGMPMVAGRYPRIFADPGQTLWLILPQFEAGGAATSTIRTEGAQAARSAELASVTPPPGASRYTAVYGSGRTVVSGPVTGGTAFDLVAGRPWIGPGNELQRLEMR